MYRFAFLKNHFGTHRGKRQKARDFIFDLTKLCTQDTDEKERGRAK